MYNNDGSSVTERELERIDSQLYTPAQSLQERLGSIHKSAEPAIAGPLSSEFKGNSRRENHRSKRVRLRHRIRPGNNCGLRSLRIRLAR